LATLGFDAKKIAHKAVDYIVCNEALLDTINTNLNMLIEEGIKKYRQKGFLNIPHF